jgi:ZIP family zinc transporter
VDLDWEHEGELMTFEGAFAWGLVSSSSLVIGAVIAFLFRIPLRVIGLIMGFGAGVLISAVAFDLIEEALAESTGHGYIAAGVFAGCLVFFGGDRLIEKLGGGDRKDPTGAEGEGAAEGGGGSSLSIVLGTVLDGIPESLVIGLTIFKGGAVGIAYLVAVFISNLPESISASSGLLASGWSKGKVLGMWIGIALISASASVVGYVLFQDASPDILAFVLAFAGGAILTMLANTMMPEAFEHGGKLVGIMVTLGFAIAFTIHVLG